MNVQMTTLLYRLRDGIVRFRIIAVWLVILGLLGFTLWRMQDVIKPVTDAAYLRQQRQTSQATTINLSDELRTQLAELRARPVDVEPDDLGTNDPFNP